MRATHPKIKMASSEPNGIFFTKTEFARVCQRSNLYSEIQGHIPNKYQFVIDKILPLKYEEFSEVVDWESSDSKQRNNLLKSFERLEKLMRKNQKNKVDWDFKIPADDFLSPEKFDTIFLTTKPVKLRPGYFRKYFEER